MLSNIEKNFQKGEIVFVKIDENSYWPGQIKEISIDNIGEKEKKICEINLINQNEKMNFPFAKIEKFEKKLEKLSKTKKQSLLNAIEEAKKIISKNKNNIILENDYDKIDLSNFSDSNLFSNFSTNEKNSERENESYIGKKVKRNKKIKGNNIKTNLQKDSKEIIKLNNNRMFNSYYSKDKKKDLNQNKFSDSIRKTIDNLLKIQIESKPNMQILILNELNKLKNIFNEKNNKNIYSFHKDIIPILNSLLYNKNESVVEKSSEIIPIIVQKIIQEMFTFENQELCQLYDNLEGIDIQQLKQDIFFFLSKNSEKKIKRNQKNKMKKIRKLSNNSFSNENKNEIENTNLIFINETFNKFINDENNEFSNELNSILNDFFENIYNKNNNLNIKNYNIRKQFCVKMFKILKKILPKKTEEELKKMIIFIEYKIRCEDPSFGKKYQKQIKRLYKTIRDKISKIK